MAERRGFRSFLAVQRLKWRYFWSRRTPWRNTLALILALAIALIIIYLAIPHNAQAWVNSAWQTATQFIASLDRVIMLATVAGLLCLTGLGLVFVRPFRRASYLATAPSAIPPITVYIDAENQLSVATIRAFKRFLMEHLNGRRADILYFMDAAQAANGPKYKELYRFGFRPVDVPHDPTGKGEVKEAVDKEIAMHAVERALRGPKKQEFILVTGDGDFVGLVYRLVALGHQVQVWATPIREAYRTLATYLDVNVLDLASVISERQTRAARPRAIASKLSTPRSSKPVKPPVVDKFEQPNSPVISTGTTSPDVLAYSGEEQLYQAIDKTLRTCSRIESQPRSDQDKNQRFRALLGGKLSPWLAGVGYSAGNRLDFWIDHLVTLQVLAQRPGKVFPTVGATSAEAAAKAMFAMANAASQAVIVTPVRDDGLVHMSEVATVLGDMLTESETVGPLRQLVEGSGARRATHTRYFVRCARALGLIEFDDVPDSWDMIRSPRLIEALSLSLDTSDVTVPAMAQTADGATNAAAKEAAGDGNSGAGKSTTNMLASAPIEPSMQDRAPDQELEPMA